MEEVDLEMKEKGLKICKRFMGCSWEKATKDDFHIEYISGGLSNMLYMCALKDHVKTQEEEPRKVMLRMYGQIIGEHPEMVVIDSVLFALLAEKKMGPQLHGVFTQGRVEQYIPSRHLNTEELHNKAISEECARVMAKFHKLKMPLCKEPTWLFSIMRRYMDNVKTVSFDGTSQPVKKAQLDKLLSYNLASELDCLENILSQVHSPVVFCHNDLQEGNILYIKPGKAQWHLLPIDFEYASYNYRGFDMGNHFCEWCYDYSVQEAPYFSAKIDHYPTRDQQLLFLRSYIEEMDLGNSIEMSEMEEHMLLEADTFALASHFLWGLWSIVQAKISKIKFGYLEYAQARFDAYFYQKKNLPSQIQVNGVHDAL